MAFQTNVFRDGEWVTETVNLHAVLKSQKAGPKGPTKPDPLKPPQCGLLTRTLVESARANSILPVRLRSPDRNDIAFVGVSLAASFLSCRSCCLADTEIPGPLCPDMRAPQRRRPCRGRPEERLRLPNPKCLRDRFL